eukprot:526332_1
MTQTIKTTQSDVQWNCVFCTFINRSTSKLCQICGNYKPSVNNTWSCTFCTFFNASSTKLCAICGHQKQLNQNQDITIKKQTLQNVDTKSNGFDCTLFNTNDNKCNGYNDCSSIKRIMTALPYYDKISSKQPQKFI